MSLDAKGCFWTLWDVLGHLGDILEGFWDVVGRFRTFFFWEFWDVFGRFGTI